MVKINQEYVGPDGQIQIHDLGVGKYDVAVDTGPSYTTQRQESAESILEAARMNPALMEIAGDILVKSFDWPHAEEISDRIKQKMQAAQQQQGGQAPPEIQAVQMQQKIEGMKAQAAAENQKNKLQADFQMKQMELQQAMQLAQMQLANDRAIAQQKLEFEAQQANIEMQIDLVKDERKAQMARETELMKNQQVQYAIPS